MVRRVPKGAKGSVDLAHTRDVPDGPVGKVGRVLVRIRGGDAPGEVRVVHDGMQHAYIAYADEPLSVGAQVLVINSRGARRIDVEPWNMPNSGVVDTAGEQGST
jgi:hypothetical protein